MAIVAALSARANLNYVGAHLSLVAATVGLLFLQQYIWLQGLSQKGYGPYETASSLLGYSAILIVVDLCLIIWSLNGTKRDRIVSMAVPALFLFVAIFIVIANNA